MESKKWYTSKTLCLNALAVIGLVVTSQISDSLDTETQATIATAVLAVINIVLRLLTKLPVSK